MFWSDGAAAVLFAASSVPLHALRDITRHPNINSEILRQEDGVYSIVNDTFPRLFCAPVDHFQLCNGAIIMQIVHSS